MNNNNIKLPNFRYRLGILGLWWGTPSFGRVLVRDLLLNPSVVIGFSMVLISFRSPRFWEYSFGDLLWIYVRCWFLFGFILSLVLGNLYCNHNRRVNEMWVQANLDGFHPIKRWSIKFYRWAFLAPVGFGHWLLASGVLALLVWCYATFALSADSRGNIWAMLWSYCNFNGYAYQSGLKLSFGSLWQSGGDALWFAPIVSLGLLAIWSLLALLNARYNYQQFYKYFVTK